MKGNFLIPRETLDAQARAADPKISAWVSANAGSGKTHVLARRVIRLLLDGVEPSKILCLTYTKAAAANMSNRVFGELSRWTMLNEEALRAEIALIENRQPDAKRLKRARRLFASALETPGGLKIQTIHAFCEAVLHQFPLEANIAGHFELLDDAMEAALVGEARRDLLTGAVGADPDLSAAFAAVLSAGGESGLDQLLDGIVNRRSELRRFLAQVAVAPRPFGPLFEEFGFAEDESAASIAAAAWPPSGFSSDYFREFRAAAEAADARILLECLVPDAARAYAESDPVERLRLAASGFLKADGGLYASSQFKKAMLARLPDAVERYGEAADSIRAAMERLALYLMLEATASALRVADRLIARYERLKSARGFLDFDDLITRTVNLLSRRDAAAWVQYKLDRGIDHILVDEAQDTSPDQWKVVRNLAEEFFAGAGARDNIHRTVFAVGDEKQSIYSFQGAEPQAFAENAELFRARVTAANRSFEHVRLQHSFRSTGDVLEAVDQVFAREEARRGLTRAGDPVEHRAIRRSAPGCVEVWSSVGPEAVEEPDDWTEPIDTASAPAARLADAIAATVAGWINDGERLPGRGRRMRAGDVMVLVRRRDAFVHALSRALKERHVPVAGADRLRLQGHIAVQDLMALARFVLQPDDDLSLAALLRSPIFGLSDDDLFRIAWNRGDGVSLFQALRQAAERDLILRGVADRLGEWRAQAGYARVFEFFSGILGRDGVQKRLIARLGSDTAEILDEFLNFCLAEEKTGLPGLEEFLATLGSAGPEIKREAGQARDEVRIMTVHAAKGLEAPVVFLVDNGAAPFSAAHLPRLAPFEPRNGGWTGRGFLWRAGAELANPFSRGLEQEIGDRAREEYRRLLYVGMTRAEDRLVVCGYHGPRPSRDPRWHGMVEAALAGADGSTELRHPLADIAIHRFELPGRRPAEEAEEAEAAGATGAGSLPAALQAEPPAPPRIPKPLSPSGASLAVEPEGQASHRSPVLDGDVAPKLALARGTAIHRLLQSLPNVAAQERAAVAGRYLARAGADWPEEERAAAWASVEAILSDPGFAPVFAPGSRAEVALMGTVAIGEARRAVSGKIDRLAVTPGRVLIVDYKTNRPPPRGLGEVPPSHAAQMALYRAMLQPIYPGCEIAAALLYTEVPELVVLPDSVLDAALARLTAS